MARTFGLHHDWFLRKRGDEPTCAWMLTTAPWWWWGWKRARPTPKAPAWVERRNAWTEQLWGET